MKKKNIALKSLATIVSLQALVVFPVCEQTNDTKQAKVKIKFTPNSEGARKFVKALIQSIEQKNTEQLLSYIHPLHVQKVKGFKSWDDLLLRLSKLENFSLNSNKAISPTFFQKAKLSLGENVYKQEIAKASPKDIKKAQSHELLKYEKVSIEKFIKSTYRFSDSTSSVDLYWNQEKFLVLNLLSRRPLKTVKETNDKSCANDASCADDKACGSDASCAGDQACGSDASCGDQACGSNDKACGSKDDSDKKCGGDKACSDKPCGNISS
ncbi:hypothetical protein [Candidatus Uabimicrobium sp. HlEnr_7]|uniref:hypothetical protein n=1 Tax=Candidatus Uabimicrobium helgolandensis TaxID=3095367 RepID=UPI0035563AE5